MRDLDKMIDEALDNETRDVLRRIGDEPGFFAQVFGIFGGRTGWVNILLLVVQGVAFVAGVWTAWHFFQAIDPVAQLRWGLPSAVLLLHGNDAQNVTGATDGDQSAHSRAEADRAADCASAR